MVNRCRYFIVDDTCTSHVTEKLQETGVKALSSIAKDLPQEAW